MSVSLKFKDKIQSFIKKEFKKKHILTKNNKVLNFYYKYNNRLNFILDQENNEIKSLIGFIPSRKFKSKKKFIWIALWIGSKNTPLSALNCLNKLQKKFKGHNLLCLGLTERVKKILKALNFKTGKLNHYYFVNNNFKKFKIIKNPELNYLNKKKINLHVSKINIANTHLLKRVKFYNDKNVFYFVDKYLKNPFYKYELFYLNNKNFNSVIVIRIITVKNRNIARIVDFCGDEKIFQRMNLFCLDFLKENNCEYIDFLNIGINKKHLNMSNFKILKNPTIIPNFFEPLILKNHNINYAYKKNNSTLRPIFFKGDGDQERPNLI